MSDTEERTHDEIDLTCKNCNFQWKALAPRLVNLDRWIDALEAEACPACSVYYTVSSQRRTVDRLPTCEII